MSFRRPFEQHLRLASRFASAFALLAILSGSVAACGSSAASSQSPHRAPGTSGTHPGPATGSGPVNVLYAGSLVDLMEKQIGPAFNRRTGYSLNGYSGGSTDLAAEIKGKVRAGDVFVSASPAADALVQGPKNGDWVSWYATFATAPVVIGYNPRSQFAAQLRSKPWWQVVTEPGFRLGRTDPTTDPKGELAAEALSDTAKKQHDPKLAALGRSSEGVYPEETLVGRLQAGQLDAGFFYSPEAVAAKIPTVPLAGEKLAATYTVTVLNRAPHRAAGQAFVRYLLGRDGRAVLRKDGFQLVAPATVTGTGVPSGLAGVVSGK